MKRLRKELIDEFNYRLKSLEELHKSIIITQNRINREILYFKERIERFLPKEVKNG